MEQERKGKGAIEIRKINRADTIKLDYNMKQEINWSGANRVKTRRK